MAVLGKPTTIKFTCYEIGHTWTPFCTHAAVGVAYSVSKEAAKIYGSLYLLTALYRNRGKKYFLGKFWRETLQSVIFLTTNGTVFIACFCIWRRLLGQFLYFTAAFMPAFTASFVAILIERKSRRGLLAVYMANVALETLYRMLASRGLVKPIHNGEVLLFSVASAVYFYFFKIKNGLPESTLSALSLIVGKEEHPPCDAQTDQQQKPRSTIQDRVQDVIKSCKPVKMLVDWLQSHSKHRLCQHQHSCISYILQGGIRMFAIGYGIQCAIKLFGSLGRTFKNPRIFLKSLFQRDNLRLGAFLGCFVAIFRAVNCLLRWIRNKEDKLHGLLSGFLAGWSMLFYKGPTVALYTATKLAEMLYFKGIASGVLPYIRCADILIYSISTAIVFHTAVIEPHNLRPAYWNFLLRVTDNRFAEMNRVLLEPFIQGCSKMFPNFWPDYDPRYTNLARQ
ncbi:hypothetical protein CHS0354_035389 [Potamilus streckersoni]|uniref:Transmembrane protein 135 N-terminal domain-containing protein n=1 Tax=Potamilus streckersoni TaxID=2493646 RepID=A0AAE0TDH4_9BIVA|nr:hypothetical protein CHS0354_035389 [Potamilus streckersoni]